MLGANQAVTTGSCWIYKDTNMIKKIYRLPDVIYMTGLSRSSIYLRVSTDEFPKPVKIGRRAIGWPEESIIAWQAKMMEAQDESA